MVIEVSVQHVLGYLVRWLKVGTPKSKEYMMEDHLSGNQPIFRETLPLRVCQRLWLQARRFWQRQTASKRKVSWTEMGLSESKVLPYYHWVYTEYLIPYVCTEQTSKNCIYIPDIPFKQAPARPRSYPLRCLSVEIGWDPMFLLVYLSCQDMSCTFR